MKKLILILAMLTSITAYGKLPEEKVYLLFTSKPDTEEGVRRYTTPKKDIDVIEPIYYVFKSKSKRYEISFNYGQMTREWIVEELRLEYDEDVHVAWYKYVTPRQLRTIMSREEVIDLDVVGPTMTAEDVRAMVGNIRFKDIYVIDRSEITGVRCVVRRVKFLFSSIPTPNKSLHRDTPKY